MKAFILDRYGRADGVRAGEMPDPELREDDVLVQIHAAGVNLLDSKVRNGEFKAILPYHLPIILGHDVAGVVVRVGSRVRRFKPGDEVYARPADGRIGAFAECIAIKEEDVAIKPGTLTMEEAASIPLVGLIAWQVLIERANLKPGQRVLIHAGAGGVGTFAIQLAKHIGATVATTTSTANVAWVRSLGADIVIDYKKEDFADRLRDYDVVLNSLDRRTLEKSLRVLKPGGQLISISGPPDAAFARSIGASWIVTTAMSVLSYGIRTKARRWPANYSFLLMRANGGQLKQITALIDAGIIRPVVDRVFPFASTKEAMAYVEGSRAKGKVVVSVRAEDRFQRRSPESQTPADKLTQREESMTTTSAIRLASLVTAINVLVASGFSIAAIIRPHTWSLPNRSQRRRRCCWRCMRRRAQFLWRCSHWARSTSRRRLRC